MGWGGEGGGAGVRGGAMSEPGAPGVRTVYWVAGASWPGGEGPGAGRQQTTVAGGGLLAADPPWRHSNSAHGGLGM